METVQMTMKKNRTSDQPKTGVALKRLCKKNGGGCLKDFARSISSDPLVKEWKDHKRGSLEKMAKKKRLENKGGRIMLEKSATRLARRKSKGSASKPTA